MLVSVLRIEDGPLKGQKFRIREGLRIGRASGEIILDDAKVSSLHAQIELDKKGAFVLVDRGSANGLKINSQKVKRVAMLPGVKFQVGRTTLKVVEERGFAEPEPPRIEERRKWQDVLLTEIPKAATRNLDLVMTVSAFRPALKMDFVQGIQFEHSILLGYGPRRFGSDVLDIELQEPLCPPVAFEIISENGVPLFRTQYPKLIFINGNSYFEAVLKEGDQIAIGQTLIQVSFAA